MKALSSRKKSSKRHKLIFFAILVSLISGSVGAYYIYKTNQKSADNQTTTEIGQTAESGDDTEAAGVDKDQKTQDADGGLPDNSATTTTDQVETSSALSVKITSTSQSNGIVFAKATTNGTGTCEFLYKPGDGGKPVSKTVSVSAKSCSFSASQNEFNYIGKWTLKVTYYSGGKKVEAVKNVTIY